MSNVCIFGDSLAKGVVFDSAKQKYSSLAESFVNTVCSAFRFETKNFSRFGCTVTKGAEIVRRHTQDISDSKYTVLEFGGNDSDFKWSEIAASPESEHEPNTTMELFSSEYRRIITDVRSAGGQPVLLNLPPIAPDKYFEWISRGLDAKSILRWLGGTPEYIYRWHESYSAQICEIARDEGTLLIDIRSPLLLERDYRRLLCEDGIHPNEEGHRFISRIIERRIAEYSEKTA